MEAWSVSVTAVTAGWQHYTHCQMHLIIVRRMTELSFKRGGGWLWGIGDKIGIWLRLLLLSLCCFHEYIAKQAKEDRLWNHKSLAAAAAGIDLTYLACCCLPSISTSIHFLRVGFEAIINICLKSVNRIQLFSPNPGRGPARTPAGWSSAWYINWLFNRDVFFPTLLRRKTNIFNVAYGMAHGACSGACIRGW